MKSLHCLPIQAKSMAELEARLKAEASRADVVEVWLDSIEDLRLAEIFFEKESIKTPFLFVNKDISEKGNFMGSEEDRIAVLVEMFERGAQFVDVGIQTDPTLIQELVKAKKGNSKLIISYHNFDETPDLLKLKKIVKEAITLGADIVKIATFVNKRSENVSLFEVTRWSREEGIEIIVVGMGEEGRISRLVCPILGSYLYYAPLVEGEETASGQFTIEEIRKIWKLMED